MLEHTHHGKIARLPRNLRHELNQRLADGESNASLLAWLSAQSEVKALTRETALDPRAETEADDEMTKLFAQPDLASQMQACQIVDSLLQSPNPPTLGSTQSR